MAVEVEIEGAANCGWLLIDFVEHRVGKNGHELKTPPGFWLAAQAGQNNSTVRGLGFDDRGLPFWQCGLMGSPRAWVTGL